MTCMPLRYLELDNNIYDMLLQGLLSVVNEIFPLAEHRMCARHIYANWRKKHRLQEYQKRFWKIAKASSEMLFNHYKNKLANKTPRGWKDL